MTKKIILSAIAALVAMPVMGAATDASANCAYMSGSYLVTCESGVKVYRHNAPSLRTVGLDKYTARVETAKIYARESRRRTEAYSAIAADRNRLRQQALDNQRMFYRRATRPTQNYGRISTVTRLRTRY
ncbi:hypothetical protein ACJ3XI_10010 [Litorimonas sp. RW-G-Af-16]|uniref:hypothetical protein n=1 Tax=Litorimonas sp. RW-G-Af-16 TaxID=3241168 RepID=UPI00390C7729